MCAPVRAIRWKQLKTPSQSRWLIIMNFHWFFFTFIVSSICFSVDHICFIRTLNQRYSLVVFDMFTFWVTITVTAAVVVFVVFYFGDEEYRTIKSHYVHVCVKRLRFHKKSSVNASHFRFMWMNFIFHSFLEIFHDDKIK